MKKLLLSVAVLIGFAANSQTTIFSEDFESGSSAWSFNGSGDNAWIVNSTYFGGGFVTDTPDQPGSLQTNYMHIMSGLGCSILGACNANFDTGSASNQNADQNTGMSTVGMNTVTIGYIYLCAGATGVSYGSLEYSVDGGSTWTQQTTYSQVSSWTTESITNPAWSGIADLRFRFKWQNGGAGNDPSFAVDNILITAISGGAGNTLATTNDVSPSDWCQSSDQVIQVNYTSTGTWNGPNMFSVELSDAAGSFAAPTVIGTQMSTAGSGTINATVPGATAAGTGYRVRVVGSDPSTTGTDNTSDLTINALPSVTMTSFADVCVYDAFFTLTGGSPASGTYSGAGVTANVFDPTNAGTGTHTITYSYTDGNGCANSAQETIFVDACSSLDEVENISYTISPNPTNETFVISTQDILSAVELYDMSGRKIKNFEVQASYNVSEIPSGVYVVKLTGESTQAVERIIIK